MSFNVDGLNYDPSYHKMVRETACTSCGAPRGVRCTTRSDLTRGKFGKVLAPCRSHRARFEAHRF